MLNGETTALLILDARLLLVSPVLCRGVRCGGGERECARACAPVLCALCEHDFERVPRARPPGMWACGILRVALRALGYIGY